jgi:pimeloyl-ACP methyl ester carboxylesterase
MSRSAVPPLVLVHGARGGAWIWRRVLGPLRAAGHEVHAVTLTGDSERAHLRRPDISLRTHIDDVVGLVEAEELPTWSSSATATAAC